MLDELNLITKIQKQLKESCQRIGDSMVSGGVDNMEKYKYICLLYTSPSPRDRQKSRMPSSA